MAYNFSFAVSATVTAKVVEEMIKKVVEEQTGRKIRTVTFKTRTVSSGYGRDEYDRQEFDGCTVDFEPDITPRDDGRGNR